MNLPDSGEIPIGFGMALMQNPQAYMRFMGLPPEERRAVIDGTHGVASKVAMRDYVNQIALQG